MPYDVNNDPYIDKDTGILRNLLGITTQKELDDAEARITSVEITVLTSEDEPDYDEFTAEFFKGIHNKLFREIYIWAGNLRTVELSKGETSFARVEHLEISMDELFKQLKKEDYLSNLSTDALIAKLSHYYGDLIVLHPFREGNGRVIRTFLAMLADSLGWHIAWDEMNPEENISASIAAYQGDDKPLKKMMKDLITPVDVFSGRDPYEFI